MKALLLNASAWRVNSSTMASRCTVPAYTGAMADWRRYLESNRDRLTADYLDYLRIPSVSAQSEHAPDVRRAGEWVAARLSAMGIEHVEVLETGGHPVV